VDRLLLLALEFNALTSKLRQTEDRGGAKIIRAVIFKATANILLTICDDIFKLNNKIITEFCPNLPNFC